MEIDPVYIEKIKSMKDLYYILGKYWTSFLNETGKKKIDDFLKELA